MKYHNLQNIVIDCNCYSYFYVRIKNDVNGNPRYNVFIINPDGPAVYETMCKCYDFQIPERVKAFIENKIGVTVPF